jgi:hypothetical protein
MATRSVRCSFLDPRLPAVEVALPSTVARTGGLSSFGVVRFGTVELELNDSHRSYLPEFFGVAGAHVEDAITLHGGRAVRLGRVGARNGTGHCFALEAGERRLLGATPPGTPVATLAAWLADLHVTATAHGLALHPRGRARWAPGRAPHVVLVVVLRSGQRVLLDVRPTYRKARSAAVGLAVGGGRLSRVTPPERPPYLTLDAPDHVVHLLTASSDGLDEVAGLGARLGVRAFAGATAR